MIPFITIFLLIFASTLYKKPQWGWFIFVFLLPTYLVRFEVLGIPSTMLEGMVGILTLHWVWQIMRKDIQPLAQVKTLCNNHPSFIFATILFLIAATVGVVMSPEKTMALGAWKAFFVEPVLIAVILYTSWKDEYLPAIVHGFLLSGALLSLLAIYQHFTGWMVPWDFWENRDTFRVTGWYGFPNGVGFALAPTAILAGYLATHTWKSARFQSMALATLAIMSTLGVFFAKSTGALIAIAGALGLGLLMHRKTRWFALAAGVIGAIALFTVPQLAPIRTEVLLQDRSGQIRVEMWAETTVFIQHHPWFGAGLMGYQSQIYPYRIDKWIEVFHHPHNLLLTMWVNLGILGILSMLWLIIWSLRVLIMYKNVHSCVYLLLFCGWLIMGLVDTPYIKNDLAILVWILFTLIAIHHTPNSPLCRVGKPKK